MTRNTITGLTIAKNVISRGYPLELAFNTVKDLFDELVIVYGKSDDGTLELLNNFQIDHGGVKIVPVKWRDGIPKELGRVTNAGLKHCTSSWVYYFQADEFADKRNLEVIREAVERGPNSYLFPFIQFAGDIGHIQSEPPYKYAIRLFRNKKMGVSADLDGWSFTGYKIFSALQINRIFPASFLDFPIYHAHNFSTNKEREIARGDNYSTGEPLPYNGYVPPELTEYYSGLETKGN